MTLDDTLHALAADPYAAVDLPETALLLAAEANPALEVPLYLSKLDDYAETLRPRLRGSLEGKLAELRNFLFDELGFAGNTEAYYDPRNSYFDAVLDRRLGIPITLTLVAMAVGERAGIAIRGIGLPGHFIAQACDDRDEILFDPFHGGGMLDREGCESLVGAVLGRPFQLTPECLAPVPPGFFILRMLSNLKGIHLRSGNFDCAATVIRRVIQLTPKDKIQQRDLGVSLVHAGRFGEAVDPLRMYMTAQPEAEDRSIVRDFLNHAMKQLAQWN